MRTLTRVAACFVLATLALAANFSGALAQADDYPSRPVRIIVGFGPGSTADYSARTVAQKLSLKYGQQFVVESRAGAGSQPRRRVRRARAEGRLHAVDGHGRQHHQRHDLEAQLRLRQGLRAGRAGLHGAEHPGGASLDRLPHRRRPGGGGEAPGDDVRLVRRRQRAARLWRAAQHRRRHQAHPCALPRQRAVAHRPAGRADFGDVLAGADGAAAHPGRRADRDRGDEPATCCPICRPWRTPATRASMPGSGSACLRPPERRARSSTRSPSASTRR